MNAAEVHAWMSGVRCRQDWPLECILMVFICMVDGGHSQHSGEANCKVLLQ